MNSFNGCQSVRCVAGGGSSATSCTTAPVYAGVHLDGYIKLHLDTYIQELIAEYQLIRPKFLKQKKVPKSPGLVLDTNDCPETLNPVVHEYRNSIAQ